jgi:8-oxo-dGTP pyrophosphatase MutT (NUDIX family)
MSHIHEKIDITVDVLVVFQNRVLLRRHDKYDKWLPVGGHIELDEDPNQAAVREVKEEVGLDIVLHNANHDFKYQTARYQELIPPKFLNRHRINQTHEHVDMIYFAAAKSDKIIESQNEKSKGLKWFTREELVEAEYGVDEVMIFYAQEALKELGNI